MSTLLSLLKANRIFLALILLVSAVNAQALKEVKVVHPFKIKHSNGYEISGQRVDVGYVPDDGGQLYKAWASDWNPVHHIRGWNPFFPAWTDGWHPVYDAWASDWNPVNQAWLSGENWVSQTDNDTSEEDVEYQYPTPEFVNVKVVSERTDEVEGEKSRTDGFYRYARQLTKNKDDIQLDRSQPELTAALSGIDNHKQLNDGKAHPHYVRELSDHIFHVHEVHEHGDRLLVYADWTGLSIEVPVTLEYYLVRLGGASSAKSFRVRIRLYLGELELRDMYSPDNYFVEYTESGYKGQYPPVFSYLEPKPKSEKAQVSPATGRQQYDAKADRNTLLFLLGSYVALRYFGFGFWSTPVKSFQ